MFKALARYSKRGQLLISSRLASSQTPKKPIIAPNLFMRAYNRGVSSKSREAGDFTPISWKTVFVTFALSGVGIWYLNGEKKVVEDKRKQKEAEMQRASYGKPNVGGPFKLIDCESGTPVTEKDFLGKFMVIYFGFTNCPDVCPDELEKMSKAITKIDKFKDIGNLLTPVFISVDPQRDTPELVRQYIKEFHPRFVGLTGSEEEVVKAAKNYRIYVSKGEPIGEDGDYLVDHSIFFFLMSPEGALVDFYGRNVTSDEITESMIKHIRQWKMDKAANRV